MSLAIWIKAKADDFYRAKDYRSAVNAYSEAYEMDESMIAYVLWHLSFVLT